MELPTNVVEAVLAENGINEMACYPPYQRQERQKRRTLYTYRWLEITDIATLASNSPVIAGFHRIGT